MMFRACCSSLMAGGTTALRTAAGNVNREAASGQGTVDRVRRSGLPDGRGFPLRPDGHGRSRNPLRPPVTDRDETGQRTAASLPDTGSGAPGFVAVASVGGAHGRTPDLLPSSRRQDPEEALPAKHPMPIPCADWRSWALVYAGIGVRNAGGQQPSAVGAGTDADTVQHA